jgi:hypothetical protein
MIWNPDSPQYTDKLCSVEVMMGELEDLCGDALNADEARMKEIALAIEAALDEQDGDVIREPHVLVALTAKALLSIGEELAARRLFLLGSGVVRPSRWEIAGDKAMWILDLKSVWTSNSGLCEMELFGCLHQILESISDVWDEVDGRGVLGLMHVNSFEKGSTSGNRLCTCTEIMDLCSGKLKRIGLEKGWTDCPSVIKLDM